MFTILCKTYFRTISPTLVSILIYRELIMLREEERQARRYLELHSIEENRLINPELERQQFAGIIHQSTSKYSSGFRLSIFLPARNRFITESV
jgi:hypothetical protein